MEIKTEDRVELTLGEYELISVVRDYLASRWIIDPRDAHHYRGELRHRASGELLLAFIRETKRLDFKKV